MEKNFIVECIVEIPKGSSNKYEYIPSRNIIKLDRVLPGANFYPGEYGFIEKTLDWDGDCLDVIFLSTYKTFPGCHVDVKILGTINMIDDNEIDTKLFGVMANDKRFEHTNNLDDVSINIRKEIETFFLQYKVLQNKEVKINGWGTKQKGIQELNNCLQRYQDYKHVLKEKGIDAVKKIWNQKKEK